MKKIMLFICLSLCAAIATAQSETTIRTTQSADIEKLFAESRWLFPQFQEAIIYLQKSRSRAKMNYDLLAEKMVFISPQSDTLALTNNDVVIIHIDKRYFKPYNKYYLEMLKRGNDNELFIRRQIKKTDSKKTGAYGLPSATTAATNINTVNAGSYFQDIEVAEWSQYNFINTYYLSVNNRIRVANKSGFLRGYSKHKKLIEAYLKENPVDVDVEEELLRLFDYCNTL